MSKRAASPTPAPSSTPTPTPSSTPAPRFGAEACRARLTADAFRGLNRIVRPAVKVGLGSPPPVGVGAVVVETTGRRSGLPRQVPLLGLRLGSRVVVSTVRPGSLWVKNLEADDRASMWVGGRRRPVRAEVRRGPLTTVTLDRERSSSVNQG